MWSLAGRRICGSTLAASTKIATKASKAEARTEESATQGSAYAMTSFQKKNFPKDGIVIPACPHQGADTPSQEPLTTQMVWCKQAAFVKNPGIEYWLFNGWMGMQ